MPIFDMHCSICDETFALDRPAVPVTETAPSHAQVYRGQPDSGSPCLGSGKRMIQPAR